MQHAADFKMQDKKTFAEGQAIFAEGAPPRDAYLIVSGSVRISKKIDGKDVVLGMKKAGDVFGEMALIDNAPRMAAAVAAESPTVVVVITQSLFKEHMDKATPLLKKVLMTFTDNLRKLSERLS
jgi:CRP-like cAMP-binding protein